MSILSSVTLLNVCHHHTSRVHARDGSAAAFFSEHFVFVFTLHIRQSPWLHDLRLDVIMLTFRIIPGAARAGPEARLAAAIVNSPVCARVRVLCDGM